MLSAGNTVQHIRQKLDLRVLQHLQHLLFAGAGLDFLLYLVAEALIEFFSVHKALFSTQSQTQSSDGQFFSTAHFS